MKKDYTALDRAIMERILMGKTRFIQIDAGEVSDLAHALTDPGKEKFRTVDKRLQAMRKAGKIEFVSAAAGWRVK